MLGERTPNPLLSLTLRSRQEGHEAAGGGACDGAVPQSRWWPPGLKGDELRGALTKGEAAHAWRWASDDPLLERVSSEHCVSPSPPPPLKPFPMALTGLPDQEQSILGTEEGLREIRTIAA